VDAVHMADPRRVRIRIYRVRNVVSAVGEPPSAAGAQQLVQWRGAVVRAE
jgi:hypothetical protein